METATKPVITVFGATGAQGGAVATTLLHDGSFAVRAVTRNPDGAAAKALAEQGAEVIRADLNDVESLRSAVSGCYAVFAVTAVMDESIGPNEERLAVQLAEISQTAGVQLFIWASLPNTDRLSNGRYPVEPFSSKAKAWDTIKKLESLLSISVEAPFFYQNLENPQHPLGFQQQPDGSILANFPLLAASDKVAFFDVRDIGIPVLALLKAPGRFDGKRIVFSSSIFSQPISSYQQTFTDVTGRATKLSEATYQDTAAALGKIFADAFLYIKEFGYFAGEADEVDVTQVIEAPFTTFEQWLRGSSIPEQFQ